MERDAFNQLIGIFRDEGRFYNEPSFFIGKVINSLPNLKVVTNGIELDRSDLKIDKFVLDSNSLFNGDSVVLLKNENSFIIISKVVSI
jgi:hypothetical protein